jgi:hypothetical protein
VSHGSVRELCKAAVLGTNYGMGAETLAGRIGKPVAYAASCSSCTVGRIHGSGGGATRWSTRRCCTAGC